MNRHDHPEASGLVEFAFFLILFLLLLVGLWFGLRKPIMWVSFYTSFHAFGVYEHLPWLMTAKEYQLLQAGRANIPGMNPTLYGLKALWQLFEIHGYVWRWIVVPALLVLGWKTRVGVVRFRYRREIKDVYALIDIQAKHFPASAIIQGKNLLTTHPYVGPWATYALPLDFTLDNGLLWTSKRVISGEDPVDEKTMVRIPPLKPEQKIQPFPIKRKAMPHHRYVAFHVARANAVFSAQMGPLWEGAEKLPPLEKALYAALCAAACGRTDDCWAMIERLAFSFREGTTDKQGRLTTPHQADTSGTNELLSKYGNDPAVRKITETHAYSQNVIGATLNLARTKGKLLHANVLWLKPVNRTLWYVVCGDGGQSAYWEAAGPWAHAQVESLMGKRITTPMVAGAVIELFKVMSREHWIDPGEYSQEAQQRLVRQANALLDEESRRQKDGKQRGMGSPLAGARASGELRTPPVARPETEDEP